MKRNIMIAAAVAAILGTGGIASAATYSNNSDEGEAREVAAVLNAKTPLANAIATVEAEGRGQAVAAGAEDKDGKVFYEVTTAEGGRMHEWRVDPATGKVLDMEAEDDDGDEKTADIPTTGSTSLVAAIATAEQHAGGIALEAEYEHEDGALVVEVEVIHPEGTVKEVIIDAASGKILSAKS